MPRASFLKAMGPGAGFAGGGEPASRGWEAQRGALGLRGELPRCAGVQAEGREGRGWERGFLSLFACLSFVSLLLWRLPAPEICFFHPPLLWSSSPLVCLQRPGTAPCSRRTSRWEGAGVCLSTQMNTGGRGLRQREGWDLVGGRKGAEFKFPGHSPGSDSSWDRGVVGLTPVKSWYLVTGGLEKFSTALPTDSVCFC